MPKSLPDSANLLPVHQQFFRPTPLLRKLLILKSLQISPLQSQTILGKKCGLTAALINRYLEVLQTDGLIQVRPVNKRDLRYDITAKGLEFSDALMDTYGAEVARTYAFSRSLVADRLASLSIGPDIRAAVFGASATGEILLMALARFPHVHLVAVVDSDRQKVGKPLLGYMVSSPDCLSAILPDVVFVASWGMKQQILDTIDAMSLPESVRVITL